MVSPDGEEAIVSCGTTKGDIKLKLVRKWSPNGYDRAVELFERHFYDHSHFFRAVPNFLVQFGITYSHDKELQAMGRTKISDDPQLDPPIKFEPGIISYAGSGPNSRTAQLFFSYGSNPNLGTQLWETPIGKVIEGMENVEQFYSYGDMPPWGKGPVQGKIYNGPQYIENNFPLIDKFLECSVERIGGKAEAEGEASGSSNDDGIEDTDDMQQEIKDQKEMAQAEMKLEQQEEAKVIRSGLIHATTRRIGEKVDSQNLITPVVMFLVLAILFVSLRGKRKESTKMN